MYSLALGRHSKESASQLIIRVGLLAMVLLSLGFVLVFGHSAQAEDNETSATGSYRMAVVNMADVLKRSPQSAAESQLLEDKFADRERALADEQEALTQAEDAFAREAPLLSVSDRVARESKLRARQRKLKRNREDLREEVRIAKDSALNRLQTTVLEAIKAIREQESIDIIFRETDYIDASERVDITGKVLGFLQQRFEEERSGQTVDEAPAADSEATSSGEQQ